MMTAEITSPFHHCMTRRRMMTTSRKLGLPAHLLTVSYPSMNTQCLMMTVSSRLVMTITHSYGSSEGLMMTAYRLP